MKIAALVFWNIEVYKTEKLRPYEMNVETLAAIKAMDDMISEKIPTTKYASADELFEDLES